MNASLLEWLGEYQACASLAETETATEGTSLVGDYLAKKAMLKQLLAYRLGVKSK